MNRLLWLLPLLFASCGGSENYVPKPHGFPRMILPAKAYRQFDSAVVPYSFEMPVYSRMEKDTSGFLTLDPTWYNLNFKPMNATLHLTYYRFNSWNKFDSLVYDTRKLVNKHIQKADDIIEEEIQGQSKDVKGVLFRIQGNTATNLNFYLTDSVKNFFRGALYFNSHTSQDSIAPVYEFVRKDVMHLINTFHWK